MLSLISPVLRTIDELLRDRAEKSPDVPIFAYPVKGLDYEDFTYKQIDVYAYAAGKEYSKIVPVRTSSNVPNDVVALLGPSNFDYFIATLALAKLGHSVLFLSTRISEAAYLSLMTETGAKTLIYDPAFKDISRKVSMTLKGVTTVEIFDQSVYRQPYSSCSLDYELDTQLNSNLDPDVEANRIAWIIHSSGSTGLPKSIPQTNVAALTNYSNNLNMKGFITLPIFHAHGISSIFRALYSGKQIHMYNASLPLTSPNIIKVMKDNDFEVLYGVPYSLKLLGETEEGLNILRILKIVMFGGSSCPDVLGNKLVENGVYLVSHYGTYVCFNLITNICGSLN